MTGRMDRKARSRSRKIVVASTALFLVWPLAQLVLVEVAHTNPWRLMGFGMYATAHEIKVTLKKEVAGCGAVEVEPRDLPPAARDAYEDFVADRRVLGRLCSPASFVERWRRVDPSVGRVEVEIEVLRLKRARMTTVARDHVSL